MVGGSLRVLRLLPPLRLVAMILLKVALNTINQIKSIIKMCLFQMLKKNKESLEDLNHLLKVDSKNTAAKKEMEVVKGLWREVRC